MGKIINKFLSSWNDYKKTLKHDDRRYSLESLQRHFRIEENSRNIDRNANSFEANVKVNVIDVNKNKQKNKFQAKNDNNFKKNSPNPKYENNNNKKKKIIALYVVFLIFFNFFISLRNPLNV